MITRRQRALFFRVIGVAGFLTPALVVRAAEKFEKVEFSAPKSISSARAGGVNPTFELSRALVQSENLEFALYYKSKVFDDDISAGVARVESCTPQKCLLRFLPTNSVRVFPIALGQKMWGHPMVPTPLVVQMMDDGTLPKGPDDFPDESKKWRFHLGYHFDSYFMEENTTDDLFNSAKFMRSRAPMKTLEFEFQWKYFGYHKHSSSADLPTKNFFGDSIASATQRSSQSLFGSYPVLKKLVLLKLELTKETETFTTSNENDAIFPSTNNFWWLGLDIAYNWPWNIYSNKSQTFAVKIGQTRAALHRIMKGSVADTGLYARGTSSSASGQRVVFSHQITTESTRWWANLWHLGFRYRLDSLSIRFSGDATPTGYPADTGSDPSSEGYGLFLGKSYEF